MSALDGRADRLYAGLTARERAALVREAAYADREADWRIYATMPDSQAAKFNGYIALMNGVNALGPFAFLLADDVARSNTLLLVLTMLVLWGEDR